MAIIPTITLIVMNWQKVINDALKKIKEELEKLEGKKE